MIDFGRRRWAGLVFISIAVSLIIVDSTIVNVAIPAIIDDLQITSTQVQWVQEAYTLVFASLLLVFGSLADRFGRRRMLLVGVAIFSLASIAAAFAPSGELLIASRFVQGVGGAMILPATLSLLNSTFRGRERTIAFAVWGSTIGGMAAVGGMTDVRSEILSKVPEITLTFWIIKILATTLGESGGDTVTNPTGLWRTGTLFTIHSSDGAGIPH